MIDVSGPDAYDAGAVTVDVLAISLREPTVAAIVSFRHTAWLWLLPLALLGPGFDVIRGSWRSCRAETAGHPAVRDADTRKPLETRFQRFTYI
ncbi:hypothetical protein, partial [Nonomuraea harbinensis]